MVPIAPSIIRIRWARRDFRVASVDIRNPSNGKDKKQTHCSRSNAEALIFHLKGGEPRIQIEKCHKTFIKVQQFEVIMLKNKAKRSQYDQ
ncbi:hypothetical protein HMP0015_2669 [Acinetobacter haemolyticus ATCC 19194]|uniref:Uncharacterized protein n=3 Tax=Acinetobacter TaxID=469 RepID=A0A5P1US98_9GAMM|nr:hypothetical protein BSR56_11125 [Acinetobacter haemolyticus]EFF81885.1 hypothetical protein HMP0015_2669 [Acinetobacter haemolyticus ATCC 19194]QER39003.1 hypothetical protein F2A31_04530 [Acinetobacter sp. C16S1]AZN68441.1 hypothetical protein DX910_09350 [Acinetobacter haemolyticus]MCU4377118.1 hypothetical protein [Acinetobacter haemolyticus]